MKRKEHSKNKSIGEYKKYILEWSIWSLRQRDWKKYLKQVRNSQREREKSWKNNNTNILEKNSLSHEQRDKERHEQIEKIQIDQKQQHWCVASCSTLFHQLQIVSCCVFWPYFHLFPSQTEKEEKAQKLRKKYTYKGEHQHSGATFKHWMTPKR